MYILTFASKHIHRPQGSPVSMQLMERKTYLAPRFPLAHIPFLTRNPYLDTG